MSDKVHAVITAVGGYLPDYILTNQELSTMMNSTSDMMTVLLACIAGISLLVGGIVSVLYHSGVEAQRIGIITPYAAQRNMIQDYLCSYGLVPIEYSSEIPVASVDAFQGSERDYIIMSCVRSTNAGRGGIGFLKEWKRLNVALTRGRMGLMILGSVRTLAGNQMWLDLIKHFQSKNVLVEGTIEDMRPSQFVNSGSSKCNEPDDNPRSTPYFPSDEGFLV